MILSDAVGQRATILGAIAKQKDSVIFITADGTGAEALREWGLLALGRPPEGESALRRLEGLGALRGQADAPRPKEIFDRQRGSTAFILRRFAQVRSMMRREG